MDSSGQQISRIDVILAKFYPIANKGVESRAEMGISLRMETSHLGQILTVNIQSVKILNHKNHAFLVSVHSYYYYY